MRMVYLKMVLVSLLFFNIVLSCEKEMVHSIPEITINSPVENQVFEVRDTIQIDADISDEVNLISIKVGLVNQELISVQPAVYLYPQSASFKLRIDYPISETNLESGEYYLLISANNEFNYRNNYHKIFINALPQQIEEIIVLTEKNSNLIGVFSVTETDPVTLLFDIDCDFAASESDSRNRRLYVAGLNLINLRAYDFETSEMVWQKDAFPPLPLHVSDCLYFDKELYASFASYYIYGYRYDGSLVFNTTVEEGTLPSRLFKFNEFILADLQSKTGDNSFLSTYYQITGTEKQRLIIHFKVVEFFSADDDILLIASNENSNGLLQMYDPYGNILTDMLNIPGTIICGVKLSETEFLIGTDNGNFLLSLNPASLIPVLPEIEAYRFRFDPLNQIIYSSEPNLINVISYPAMTVQNTFTFTDSILNFHLIYNK
jgi:hypothetical protein